MNLPTIHSPFELFVYALVALELWAFIDALIRPSAAYAAADKLTKQAWLLILGLAVASTLLLGSTILLLASIVATFVYLLDVKPALISVTRRR